MGKFIRAFFLLAPRLIYSRYTWIRKFAKHPEKYPLDYRYKMVRKTVFKIIKALRIDIHVEGKENLPKDGVFFIAPNHVSSFDPLGFIYSIEKPTTYLAKVEITKIPYVNKVIKGLEGEFINREDIKSSLKNLLKIENQLKNQYQNWVIFPEGTRNRDDKLNVMEFKHGSFRPAKKTGTPIIPACTFGWERVSSLRTKYKRYPVFVKFGKPLYKEDYENMTTEEIAKYCHDEVQKMVAFEARKHDHEYFIKNKEKNYNFNFISR